MFAWRMMIGVHGRFPLRFHRDCVMSPQKIGIVVGCVAAFAGVWAGAFYFIRSDANSAPKDSVPFVANTDSSPPASTNKSEVTTPVPGENKEIPDDSDRPSKKSQESVKDTSPKRKARQPRPLTCLEATKMGRDCIGERVTWVGKWTNSQSAAVGRGNGSKHLFNSQGAQGNFSFDYPFVAEDPKPLPTIGKGQDIRAAFDQRWGPSRIVKVSGTITNVETLTVIGQGTRYNVPVLTDITITINP
jgi:hypothetical protein